MPKELEIITVVNGQESSTPCPEGNFMVIGTKDQPLFERDPSGRLIVNVIDDSMKVVMVYNNKVWKLSDFPIDDPNGSPHKRRVARRICIPDNSLGHILFQGVFYMWSLVDA